MNKFKFANPASRRRKRPVRWRTAKAKRTTWRKYTAEIELVKKLRELADQLSIYAENTKVTVDLSATTIENLVTRIENLESAKTDSDRSKKH